MKFGSKAWRMHYKIGEFKNKRYSLSRRNKPMARRFSRARRFARKTYRRATTGTPSLWATALGVGGYIAYENYVSPMIPLNEPSKSIAELAASVWASRKGGIVGNIGKAGVVINAYQLMKPFVSNLTGISSSGSTQSALVIHS